MRIDGIWMYAIKENSFKNNDYAIIVNNKVLFYKDTPKELEAKGYRIVSEEEFNQMQTEHNKELCSKWEEISADDYDYFLNCLPPLNWTNGGFFSSEIYTGSISNFYQELNGKFYKSLQDIHTDRKEIKVNLEEHIKQDD